MLYIAKWVITLGFSFIYMAITAALIQLIFQNIKYVYISIALYVLMLLIAFLCVITGKLFDNYEMGYTIAHRIIEILLSPIIIFILIPLGKMTE